MSDTKEEVVVAETFQRALESSAAVGYLAGTRRQLVDAKAEGEKFGR